VLLTSDARRIYVAGPVTKGDQFANVATAIHAADALWTAGFAPVCPHSHSALWHMHHPHSWEEWLALDECLILGCHALLQIPGESAGADREVAFARERGIPAFESMGTLLHWANEVPR
jgi:hypothetical protein